MSTKAVSQLAPRKKTPREALNIFKQICIHLAKTKFTESEVKDITMEEYKHTPTERRSIKGEFDWLSQFIHILNRMYGKDDKKRRELIAALSEADPEAKKLFENISTFTTWQEAEESGGDSDYAKYHLNGMTLETMKKLAYYAANGDDISDPTQFKAKSVKQEEADSVAKGAPLKWVTAKHEPGGEISGIKEWNVLCEQEKAPRSLHQQISKKKVLKGGRRGTQKYTTPIINIAKQPNAHLEYLDFENDRSSSSMVDYSDFNHHLHGLEPLNVGYHGHTTPSIDYMLLSVAFVVFMAICCCVVIAVSFISGYVTKSWVNKKKKTRLDYEIIPAV